MTARLLSDTQHVEDLEALVIFYRRLGAMDQPALRALVADLQLISDESRLLAMDRDSAETSFRARRDARRVQAARAALDIAQ
jgi:hypothetical protein